MSFLLISRPNLRGRIEVANLQDATAGRFCFIFPAKLTQQLLLKHSTDDEESNANDCLRGLIGECGGQGCDVRRATQLKSSYAGPLRPTGLAPLICHTRSLIFENSKNMGSDPFPVWSKVSGSSNHAPSCRRGEYFLTTVLQGTSLGKEWVVLESRLTTGEVSFKYLEIIHPALFCQSTFDSSGVGSQ